MSDMTEREILDKAAQIKEWTRSSADARIAVRGVCMSYKRETLADLAEEEPVAFDMLYEAIQGMMTQIPEYWTP